MAIQSRSVVCVRPGAKVLPEAPVSFFSVWLLGLALGLTACTITCLPFMGVWALGRNGSLREGLFDTAAFLGGRLVSYCLLGALAGASGAWLVSALAGGGGNLVIGVASLVAALWLAWPMAADGHAGCTLRRHGAAGSPFLLGISLTLIPCAPLTTLLATCAAAGSPVQGGLYGAFFGSGAVISPMLVLIPACGGFGRVLREQGEWLMPWLRYGAASVMLLLGARRLGLVSETLMLGLPVVTLLLLLLVGLRKRRRTPSDRTILLRKSA